MRVFFCGLVVWMLTAAAAQADPMQIVTPTPASQVAGPGTSFSFDLNYSTDDPIDETLTGIGVRLHFDSTRLDFVSLTNVLLDHLFLEGIVEDDNSNHDGDALTDKLINMTWSDSGGTGGSWPGEGTTPIRLYTANFTSKAGFADSTLINFTASSTAAGRTFAGTSATVQATPEPSALALLALAMMFALVWQRRTLFSSPVVEVI